MNDPLTNLRGHVGGEARNDLEVAIGGQSCYDEGPSMLLTVYRGSEDIVEVMLHRQQIDALIDRLVKRQEWLEKAR